MADVEQNRSDAQKETETPRGGGETPINDSLKTGTRSEVRTVTIDESQVEEVPPEVGDHTVEIDRRKLRPVEGRAPTPIPSEEEWTVMRTKIQQLAASGAGEQKDQAQQEHSSQVSPSPSHISTPQTDREVSGEKVKSD